MQIQVTGLYGQFSINWPPEVDAVLNVFSSFTLNIEVGMTRLRV